MFFRQFSENKKESQTDQKRYRYPNHIFCTIKARSSTVFKFGILVIDGVIEPDYRGEIMIVVFNPSNEPCYIPENSAIAQLIYAQMLEIEHVRTDELTRTLRWNRGFGSSNT